MQGIIDITKSRKAALEKHPFYHWLVSDSVPLRRRLTFAPIMANFVMNFRDMNLWFIRFQNPHNQFEAIINGNTREDETHSRLFIEDWRKLDLDSSLGWRASDVIWWLFLADETEPFRKYGIDFARMTVVDKGDPLVRFAHSEAGEACGNAFFNVSSRVAAEVTAKTGIDYRYFGIHHLNLERGHVIESEGVFDRQHLNDEQRKKGVALANEMFDIFEGMHDCFLAYAEKYVANGTGPKRGKKPTMPLTSGTVQSQPAHGSMGALQGEVQRVLEARKRQTAEHPFYAWLQEEPWLSPLHKLQRFIPMWVMDIMGYRDLCRYALQFNNPMGDAERDFNRWTSELQGHSALFLNDWDALGMDDVLDWTPSEALEFFFLDPQTDVHRRNITGFIKLALMHEEPILRYWLLEALEASGEAFFENTKALAMRVERSTGKRLDYLADRHDVAHSGSDASRAARTFAFKQASLTPEQRDVAMGMIHTVFDAVDEQLEISLDVSQSNRFGVRNKFAQAPADVFEQRL